MAEYDEQLKERLKEKGLKMTTQRMRVLEVLAMNRGKHLTAEEIHGLVLQTYPEIGLATVYRTILLLLDLHLIDKVNLDDGFIRYEIVDELSDGNKHRHHHLICERCGKVIPFEEDLLDGLERKIMETTGFCVKDHEVKLYGCCKECGGK